MATIALLLAAASIGALPAARRPPARAIARMTIAPASLDARPGSRAGFAPASPDARADVLIVLPDDHTVSPFGATSPRPSPSWASVGAQLAARLPNYDARIHVRVATLSELGSLCVRADAVIALAVAGAGAREALEKVIASAQPQALICYACSAEAAAVEFAGTYAASGALDPLGRLLRALVPWSSQTSGERLVGSSHRLLQRHSSEDSIFAVLLLLQGLRVLDMEVVRSDVNPSWEKGAFRNTAEFANMIQCCGPQIFRALTDTVTKRAVDMLTALDLRDQVGSYRVIVSFETPLLEDFSLCILQQHNCFNCDAKILANPQVPLMQQWRGKPLDAKAAAKIFVGHLDHAAAPEGSQKLPWSWKIVCGANPAYDAFPQQHQIFYPAGAGESDEMAQGGSLWYDPVFLVETVDGRKVWCKRHYRCTPRRVAPELRAPGDSSAGAWTLSTLDNGIVSLEVCVCVCGCNGNGNN